MSQFNPDSIQIGISACLLGEKVRYDGGHKASQYCMQELSQVFSYVPVCPEMAIGLSTPRPTIRLVQEESGMRLLASDKSFDVTDAMQAFSEKRISTLDYLSGYIVCAKSPSCGMERVRVYDGRTGYSRKSGVGLYTANLQRIYPYLPVEEDGRLHDLVLKENFITRVFANHAWKTLKHEASRANRWSLFIPVINSYCWRIIRHTTVNWAVMLRTSVMILNKTQSSTINCLCKH
ncbi:DUF523 domain-containing protein [Nitrincola nitratireducens]|uniref:Uncharacterized protein n=1 Tax=Nitrincola nitratireducens TaxID=1229521 RepID=W9V1B1_9GAMM|nr:DUF523 domain-containing protein [Nitrincola nitratireducens]EXJ13119.1 hypothetical protein D791_00472 [Nitrincola nitratireducens]